jgi:hypothetical protein
VISQLKRCGPNSIKLVRRLCANLAESYETKPTLAHPSDAFGGFRVLWSRALATLADACRTLQNVG